MRSRCVERGREEPWRSRLASLRCSAVIILCSKRGWEGLLRLISLWR